MFVRWHLFLYYYRAYHENNWKRLRTTSVLERLNLEFKSRKGKIGEFPSERSLSGSAVSIITDIIEEWITGRRFMNMQSNKGCTVSFRNYSMSCTVWKEGVKGNGNVKLKGEGE